MSDFLTSLAARSFGRETAVRPRLASLFEPIAKEGVGLSELPEAEAAEMVMDSAAPETEDVGRSDRRTMVPRVQFREKDPPTKEMPAAVVVPPRVDSTRGAMDLLGERREEEKEGAARVRPRRESPSQEENRNQPDLDQPFRSVGVVRMAAPTRAAAIAPDKEESFERDRRLALPPKVAAELASSIKNEGLGNAPPSSARRERTGIASPAAVAASEPSVHVTIGRIEVRATAEGKPVSQRRAESAVMSLDEYLRRRKQGGER